MAIDVVRIVVHTATQDPTIRTTTMVVLFYGEGEAGADHTTEPLTIHGITQTRAKTTTRNIDALAIDYTCLRKGMYI